MANSIGTCKVWKLEMENTGRLTHIIKLYANCLLAPTHTHSHTIPNNFDQFAAFC